MITAACFAIYMLQATQVSPRLDIPGTLVRCERERNWCRFYVIDQGYRMPGFRLRVGHVYQGGGVRWRCPHARHMPRHQLWEPLPTSDTPTGVVGP